MSNPCQKRPGNRIAVGILCLVCVLVAAMAARGQAKTVRFMDSPFGDMVIRDRQILSVRGIRFTGNLDRVSGVLKPLIITNQTIMPDGQLSHDRDKSVFISKKTGNDFGQEAGEYRVDYSIEIRTDEVLELTHPDHLGGAAANVYTPFSRVEGATCRIWIYYNNNLVTEAPSRDLFSSAVSVDSVTRGASYTVSLPPLNLKLTIDGYERGLDTLGRYSFKSLEFSIEIENRATFAGTTVKNVKEEM